jgi:hypothetical protein
MPGHDKECDSFFRRLEERGHAARFEPRGQSTRHHASAQVEFVLGSSSAAHQRLPEGGEPRPVDRIALRIVFGVALHAEREAWASAIRIASMVPSSATPSMTTRLPGSRMPWPCSRKGGHRFRRVSCHEQTCSRPGNFTPSPHRTGLDTLAASRMVQGCG